MSGLAGGLARLNALSPEAAAGVFRSCCGSARWSEAMAAERPFESEAELFAAAESVWRSLGRVDWLEAFSHHPQIGERNLAAFGANAAQASKEQAGMATASEGERREFAKGNAEYERRFGHVFLIFASGKGSAEMLGQLRTRLGNDAATELANAAGEQVKITRLRLERWLSQ